MDARDREPTYPACTGAARPAADTGPAHSEAIADGRPSGHPTTLREADTRISEAGDHLYVALIQTLPSDDRLVVAHLREALRILAPQRLARAEAILADVAAKRARRLMALPKVFGFINSGSGDWLITVGLAEDGTCLAGHCSSSVGWAQHDIGPAFKAEQYAAHYPDGYEFVWVPRDELDAHEGLSAAIRIAEARNRATEAAELFSDGGGL